MNEKCRHPSWGRRGDLYFCMFCGLETRHDPRTAIEDLEAALHDKEVLERTTVPYHLHVQEREALQSKLEKCEQLVSDLAGLSNRQQSRLETCISALTPFAELGAFMFARKDVSDDEPLVEIHLLNNAKTCLTRGDFKAAHAAVYPEAHPEFVVETAPPTNSGPISSELVVERQLIDIAPGYVCPGCGRPYTAPGCPDCGSTGEHAFSCSQRSHPSE